MKKGFDFLGITAVFLALIFIFSMSTASATFTVGIQNYSIENIYGPSQDISGWLNISFAGEPSDANFTGIAGSVINKINLSEILKSNTGYNHSCSPVDCGNDYFANNAQASKTFALSAGNSSVYGFRLAGNIQSIDSLSFSVQSDAAPSCTNQIKVDIFDDGVTDFINNKSTNTVGCTSSQGCYIGSGSDGEYDLTGQYCQKMNLSEAPGFALGAWVKKVGERNVTIGLFDNGLVELKNCQLPDASTSGGDVFCNVNYSVTKPGQYYICIYPTTGAGTYKIKGHLLQNGCGFSGVTIPPQSQIQAAYDISAQGKQFDSPGTLQIPDSIPGGGTLSGLAANYINRKYGSLDCTSGCVIPVRFISGTNQNIILSDPILRYTQQYVGTVTESNFYDLETMPAKINSGFKKLYLDSAGFSVPSSLGNYTFSLMFDGQTIVSDKIQVKDVPIITSVTPLQTASAFPTDFTASVSSSYNLTSFSWDFGDGTARVITQGNKTTHAYNQTGEYTLTLSVTDQRKLSSVKTFLINVSSPKDLIALRLAELKASINEIKSDITSLDAFSKAAINFSLGLSAFDAGISSLQSRYTSATTETQFNSIVSDLLKLGTLPESIAKTQSNAALPFIPAAKSVNLDVLESIAGGNLSSGSEENYANAAAFWAVSNLETTVDSNEFSGRYDGKLQPVVRTFKITAKEKADIPYDYYLIMPALAGFYSDSTFRTEGDYVYINLKDQKTVSFSTTEDIDFTDLPAFISPSITKLSATEATLPEEKKTNKWLVFGLIILALIVIGIITYIILKQWYKRKYENHLFPNRNDLYNLATYINNAKKKGKSHGDIETSLKKAGWSGERIRYAIRKYAGKKTGMPF